MKDALKTTIWSSNFPQSIYLKNTETLTWKDACTAMFITALFTISQDEKKPNNPTIHRWMLKEDVVYISNKTLLLTSHKKDGIMPSSAIDGPWRYYAKWYNLEKDKKLWFHAYVVYKKTNKKFKNTDTDNTLVVTREKGKGGGRGAKWVRGSTVLWWMETRILVVRKL